MVIGNKTMLEMALDYANKGWYVLPLHFPVDGACSCGKKMCGSPAKHPMNEHGLSAATTDPGTIRDWWTKWPDANIGVRTGNVSGVVVVDSDLKNDGPSNWSELQDQHGLIETLTVLTGGGGNHMIFQAPSGIDLRNSAGKLGRGLDTRGEGGYIVAPPSVHISGDRYEWDNHAEIAAVPEWLLKLWPVKGDGAGDESYQPTRPIGDVIPVGKRNETFFSMAGSMRRRNFSEGAIMAALLVDNNRCETPLEEDEINAIAKSVCRYTPTNQFLSKSDYEPANLTSAIKTPPSEVKLGRVNAGDLQQRAFGGDMPELKRLPFLNELKDSPFIFGWSMMISAYPKTGKTELLVRLADEWSRIGVKVAFYTEEPENVWVARLSKLPEGFKRVDLIFALGETNDNILEHIIAGDDDVVIIDTLRVLRIKDENDNGLINITLTPFIAACRQGKKTLILSHHDRKGGGDHGESVAGGHAFSGIVDVLLQLTRDPHSPKRRIIKGWGRVVEVSDLLYEMQDDGTTMTLLGDPKELSLQDVKEHVMECISESWTKTSEIREALDPKPSVDQVSRALTSLAETGAIERDPPLAAGRKSGKTYKWRNLNLTSDEDTPIGGG